MSSSSRSPPPQVPPDSWDTHIHIAELTRFPPPPHANAPGRQYTPHEASLASAQANAQRLGLPNLVLVQTSTYGSDNTWIVQTLLDINQGKAADSSAQEQAGKTNASDEQGLSRPKARGVVVFDAAWGATADGAKTLRDWHRAGVRGVRVNMKSVGRETTEDELRGILQSYAQAFSAAGEEIVESWSVQFFVAFEQLPLLLGAVRAERQGSLARVKVVVDHMGGPPVGMSVEEAAASAGWRAFVAALERDDRLFVKLSAAYRWVGAEARQWSRLEGMVRELVAARAGAAALAASDWPHTRFEGLDSRPWVEMLAGWCGEEQRVRVFRDNARVVFET